MWICRTLLYPNNHPLKRKFISFNHSPFPKFLTLSSSYIPFSRVMETGWESVNCEGLFPNYFTWNLLVMECLILSLTSQKLIQDKTLLDFMFGPLPMMPISKPKPTKFREGVEWRQYNGELVCLGDQVWHNIRHVVIVLFLDTCLLDIPPNHQPVSFTLYPPYFLLLTFPRFLSFSFSPIQEKNPPLVFYFLPYDSLLEIGLKWMKEIFWYKHNKFNNLTPKFIQENLFCKSDFFFLPSINSIYFYFSFFLEMEKDMR